MNKNKKNKPTNQLRRVFLVLPILLYCLVLSTFVVSAWTTNVFTNNNVTENLTFIGIQNITRNLSVPQNIIVTKGYLNLSYVSGGINLTQNLTAYWKFNEVLGRAIDTFGYFNLSNFSTTYETGKLFNAAYFSPGSYFTGAANETLSLNDTEFTIAFWMKTNATGGAGNRMALINYCNATTGLWSCNTGRSWSLLVGNGTASATGILRFISTEAGGNFTETKKVVNDSAWHRVVLTRNATYDLDIYIDGVKNASQKMATVFDGTPSQILFAKAPVTGWDNYTGYLDDVRIYKGFAWSQTNITSDYNSGSGKEATKYTSGEYNLTLGDIQLISGEAANSTEFDLEIKSSNLATFIDSYLSTCTYAGGYCYVPFLFKSTTDMIIKYLYLEFTNEGFLEHSQSYNTTSYETQTEGFVINITYDANSFTSSGSLIYDGTAYLGTKVGTGSNVLYKKSLNLDSTGSKSFYWNISLTNSSGTYGYPSTTKTQTVSSIQFGLCNATLTNQYINFSFIDETNLTYIYGKIDSLSFLYYIQGATGGENKSLTYSTSVSNSTFAFCFSPSDKTIITSGTVQYSASGYPQRRYSLLEYPLSNTTTNKALAMMSTEYGLYSKYTAVDSLSSAPIVGVNVIAQRTINSSTTTVESGITDSAGTVTFWLNPDYDHTFTFTKTGYSVNTFTLRPTSTDPVYVPMTSTTGTGTSNVSVGINITVGLVYNILPENTTLMNNTVYTFGFNVSNPELAYDLISMNITNTSGTQLLYTSNAGEGFISGNLNTENNTRLYGYFKIVAGDQYFTFVKVWDVGNYYEGTYSLLSWLRSYNQQGFGFKGEFLKWVIMLAVVIGLAYGFSAYGSNYIEQLDTAYGSIIAVMLATWIFYIIDWLPDPYSLGILIIVNVTGIGLIIWRTFAGNR